MKRIWLRFISTMLAILIVVQALNIETKAGETLKTPTLSIGTYNLCYNNADSVPMTNATLGIMTGSGLDILGLDELNHNWYDRFNSNSQMLVNKGYSLLMTGYDSYYLGEGVLYNSNKLKLDSYYTFELDLGSEPDPWGNKRFVVVCKFTELSTGIKFVYIQTHLDWVDYYKNIREASHLNAIANTYRMLGYPVFIGGDMNPDNTFYKAVDIMQNNGFTSLSYDGSTYLGDNNLYLIPTKACYPGYKFKYNILKQAAANPVYNYTNPITGAKEQYQFSESNIIDGFSKGLSDADMTNIINKSANYKLDYIFYNTSGSNIVYGSSGTATKYVSDHKMVTGKFILSQSNSTRGSDTTLVSKLKAVGFKFTNNKLIRAPYISSTAQTVYKGSKSTVSLTGTTISGIKTTDSKIATVTMKGVITAKKAGVAAITLIGKNGKSYRCVVTVKEPYVSASAVAVYKGATTKVSMVGANIVGYSTDNKNIATINSNGVITGLSEGLTNVYLISNFGIKYKITVNVTTGMISKTSTSLYIGQTDTIKLFGPATKSVVSSNQLVVTASGNNIKAYGIGEAYVTITDVYGNVYKCIVRVNKGKLSKTSFTLEVGSKDSISLIGPAVASYRSNNEAIVSVDNTGRITGLKSGSTYVTVTDVYGFKYVADVTVKEKATEPETTTKQPETTTQPATEPETVTEPETTTEPETVNEPETTAPTEADTTNIGN